MEKVFENANVVAVIKPHGMPVQDDLSGDTSLYSLVQKEFPNAGLIHRLDRQVSGLVVFAKNKNVTSYLNKEIQDRRVEKYYYALVEGKLAIKEGNLCHYLSKDKKQKKAYEDEKGKKAELAFEVMYESEEYSLLRVHLQTGRFHQIRAQLSLVGHPIINDKKYGGQSQRGHREIGLFACRFSYENQKKEIVNIEVDVPTTWPFDRVNAMK